MSHTTLLIIAIVAILAIVLAVLILRKPSAAIERPASPQPTEGHSLVDSAAAAVLDVSTPMLGIDAHADLPSDELTRIKGLGPKAAAVLNGFGVHRYAQLADLTPDQAAELDSRMGAFKGRIDRDRWIDQARYLEQGDIGGFETEFGKLG